MGEVVRSHRQRRGLTIEGLADAAGLHPTYLSDIERGRGNPSLFKLGQLAIALDVPVSRLIAEAEQGADRET
jgi:transcriptional regulator with XRE-family HTH domain